MYDLWDELEADGEQYLRQWYDGEWWSNYVDAIIGITAQATPGDPRPIAGLAPEDDLLDEGRNFILLKWQVYWMDDNLVQHKVSHLYYAPDHPEPQPPAPCCAMAYHPHYQTWIWEGDLWWVFNDIPCAYTSYSWCTTCHQVIQQNSGRYPLRTLTISASSGGTTNPAPGTYLYGNGASVTVTAQGYSRYIFDYWILDGATKYGNEITVTMDSDHDLTAYFEYIGYVGGCPTLFVWNGSGYVDYGVIDIHNPSGEDVVREVSIAEQDLAVEDLKVNLCLQEGWLGLEYSHSEIDQVKLYAVDNDGNRLLCPLKKATYNNYNVRPILKQGDDEKLDIYLLETVDLEFLVPYQNVQGFTFVIEGCNLSKV